MGKAHETESRWTRVGEVVLWVIFYFWGLWIFNAFLPPKPEQTPFETYLKNQMWGKDYDGGLSERDQLRQSMRDQILLPAHERRVSPQGLSQPDERRRPHGEF